MKESKEITLADAQMYIEVIARAKCIEIKDPIEYLIENIAKFEKRLADFKEGVDIPVDKTQEEAIVWLSDIIECRKAYLVCYRKAQK
ncbi:MAG TPA: hypothetical protein DDY52_06140 [Candidatus Moranbacteria bacterium]|nr:MAG: hypothetical protein UR51_C0002G0069 [Candidatus Moranbacteria bacterium GW2011_GWF1_34_10]HBI17689.1 hypothetical protein [Candidatus Moranbacteria bacterium]